MDVVSRCPLPVASVMWQPKPNKWSLTFVCKATYRLTPTESELAGEQEAVNEDDNYWNDDTTRSLYAPSDLVPHKARADVILVGHAFAPRREPARSLVAQVIVGSINKAIECFCDRMWTLDGQLREGPRLPKIPLRYERAAGGPDTTNPVGMRPDAVDAYGMIYLPNLQPPGRNVPQRGETIEPIGFGPIAPTWPSRAEKLGRYAPGFSPSAWNRQPVPEDLDRGYWNCAPRDQQISAIRPNERIILENLHPEHPRLVTNLPGTVPLAVLERAGAPPEEIRLKCDTLWIDTDRSLCTLVWRGNVPLEHPAQAGRVVVSIEGVAARDPQRHAWGEVPQPAMKPPTVRPAAGAPAGRGHLDDDITHVATLEEMGGDGLPFQRDDDDDDKDVWKDTTAVQPAGAAGGALPFTGMGKSQPTLPFQPRPRPSMPSMQMPVDPAGKTLRATDAHLAPPPPMPAPQAPPPPPVLAAQAPPPPPLIRPAPTMDPIAPAQAVTSPWAQRNSPGLGGPGLGGHASAPPPPAPLEPSTPSPSFGAKFEPPVVPSASPSPAVAIAAATGGVVGASNAAAAMTARGAGGAAVATTGRAQASPSMSREVLMLLWYDPSCVKDLPKNPRWDEILKQPDEDPKEDGKKKKPDGASDKDENKKSDGDSDGDNDDDDADLFEADEDDYLDEPPEDEGPAEEDVPPEVRERRQVFKIIARGEPSSAAGLNQEVADSIKKDGTLEPPLVLVAGELVFPFDELETLKATVTAVSPLVAGDKKLKEVVDTVNELLKTPWLSRSGSVAEGLTSRIKEAFAQGNRMLPPSYLDTHTERMLLEERHYQKRTVFGETWIRSLFIPAFSQEQIPAYLPESLTKKLPMFQRLKTRLIAEVHMQQDQYEAQPTALRVVALARVSALPQAGGGGKPS